MATVVEVVEEASLCCSAEAVEVLVLEVLAADGTNFGWAAEPVEVHGVLEVAALELPWAPVLVVDTGWGPSEGAGTAGGRSW